MILRILLKPIEWIFLLLIFIYQKIISPSLMPSCRYTPTCSQYGIEAIKKYGPLKGGWLTIKRFSRCHPWGGHGHDPVPWKIVVSRKSWVVSRESVLFFNFCFPAGAWALLWGFCIRYRGLWPSCSRLLHFLCCPETHCIHRGCSRRLGW